VNVVVPLAGPDFIHPRFGVRPLFPVEGEPLILRALGGRPWIASGEVRGSDLIFVLRDLAEAAGVRALLADRYPGCRFVALSALTGGALLSAMAGAALVADGRRLCIDLVDILFDWPDWTPAAAWPERLGGLAPVFASDDPAYSYLDLEDGRMLRAAEKQVISAHASAGVYLFRDLGVFTAAAAHSLAHRETLAHKGVLFVCPALNGVAAQGLEVRAAPVGGVRPVGKLFH
jgi:hypothetical protein